MSEESIRQQLENLKFKDSRIDTLNEIKNQLKLNPSKTNSSLLLKSYIFDIAEDNDTEQKSLACDILNICMSNLNLEHTENNFSEVIERFLQHENEDLRAIGINEIDRVLRSTPDPNFDDNTVLLVIKCLQSKETKVGTPSIGVSFYLDSINAPH